MPRHKTRHPPPSLRCPHCRGSARDLFYHSTYRTRDGPRTLWRCRRFGKGKPGRPPKPAVIPDPALLYGQVEKTREGRRVTKVEKKLVLGTPTTDLAFVSTSLLERQNGTARSRNRYLVRKTYGFAKLVTYMGDQCEVDKTFYNFCRKHRGLGGETPAMRQGITDHVWTAAEVLGYRSASP